MHKSYFACYKLTNFEMELVWWRQPFTSFKGSAGNSSMAMDHYIIDYINTDIFVHADQYIDE